MASSMRSAFAKEVLRSITGSLGRFIAIAAIVALGCGFYAGLRMVYPDMNLAADRYYDGTHLMDVRVVSTYGLTDDDLEALRQVEGVDQVMGAYETDAVVELDGDDYTFRIHSLPAAASMSEQADEATVFSDDDGYLNRLILAEGAWPQNASECVISADAVMNGPVDLGSTVIRVMEGVGEIDDVLAVREFTVVGLVHASYYPATNTLGPTTLGSGSLDQFMYVEPTAFAADYPYTEAFLTVSGAMELATESAEYEEKVDRTIEGIEAIAAEREQARLDGLKGDAQTELDDARADYERQRSDAEAELASAQRKLDAAARDIASGESELADAQRRVAESEQALADGRAEYEQGVRDYEEGRDRSERELAAAKQELDDGQTRVDAAKQQLGGMQQQLAGVQQLLQNPDLSSDQRAELEAQAGALEQGIATVQSGIARGEAELAAGRAQYEAGKAVAEAQLEAARQKLAAARQELADGERQLEEGRKGLADGESELAEGKAAYARGKADYLRGRSEADEGFADAERELADAQADIDAIDRPEWLIMGRDKNYGAASFKADAERVDHIAALFPFIFFLVAALVALTTMTRMVEEERRLIGTFKALGYARNAIIAKYLVYAGAASIAGAVIGILVLSYVLPVVVMEAYSIVYYVPRGPLPVNVPIALASAGLGVGITLVATWAAASSTLREAPAQLMLPRAPKAGKRILLERARPLWKRLSFSWKVTFRNIFRYKKRFVMTVIGIAGCTALLLTGFGLSDAINGIIDKQYGQIVLYDAEVTLEDSLDADERAAFDDRLAGDDAIESSASAAVSTMCAVAPDGTVKTVSVVVPDDVGAFEEQLAMRDRTTRNPIAFQEDGIIVTEKLADMLGIGIGDDITLAEQDSLGNATDETHTFRIASLMENYVANYVYLTAEQYGEAFGGVPDFSTVFVTFSSEDVDRDGFSERIRSLEGVKTFSYTDEVLDTYRTMLRSVNMIVIVLVIAAAALAFIVLYNLTNINITERMREIATLKVLGFTRREVDLYIYRETLLLSIIGCAVGLALGIPLESFVILSAEVDQVMFSRDIFPMSFAFAFLLTMAFTVFVMLVMRRKLDNVDMVESLKSNE